MILLCEFQCDFSIQWKTSHPAFSFQTLLPIKFICRHKLTANLDTLHRQWSMVKNLVCQIWHERDFRAAGRLSVIFYFILTMYACMFVCMYFIFIFFQLPKHLSILYVILFFIIFFYFIISLEIVWSSEMSL